jgi:hypothetical protein
MGVRNSAAKGCVVLWTVAALFFILWFLGVATIHAPGAYVHVLLILAHHSNRCEPAILQ